MTKSDASLMTRETRQLNEDARPGQRANVDPALSQTDAGASADPRTILAESTQERT